MDHRLFEIELKVLGLELYLEKLKLIGVIKPQLIEALMATILFKPSIVKCSLCLINPTACLNNW
jgi:hypothetical protein